jgi:hypothetical protein
MALQCTVCVIRYAASLHVGDQNVRNKPSACGGTEWPGDENHAQANRNGVNRSTLISVAITAHRPEHHEGTALTLMYIIRRSLQRNDACPSVA